MKNRFIVAIFVLIWLGLLVRVFYLSVSSNKYYEKLSYANSIKSEFIASVRGEIVDRNNNPIAINQLGFKIQLAPHLVTKNSTLKLERELDELVRLLPELNKEKMLKEYKKSDSPYNHNFIDVVPFISYEKIMPIYTLLNLNENLKLVSSPKRYYPNNEIACHIVGYVAKASPEDIKRDPLDELSGFSGKNGLERYYNDYLRGEAGKREIKVNANNQEVEELSYTQPKEDVKLTLTIDMELQKFISSLFKDKAGAVVVMGVDGSILSASSFPEFDPNSFVNGMDYETWDRLSKSVDRPFTNKLINGLYAPGSTIKTGLGLIYSTSSEVGGNFGVTCNAEFLVGNRVFRCWKKEGHGYVDLNRAIRESCDDFFYKGSLKLGIDKMSKELVRYGLGRKTEIDLPNEFVGIVPSREWKLKRFNQAWYIGETINSSIGQGDFLSTPMQLTRFTALMATGRLPRPHLARYLGDEKVADIYEDILTKEELDKLPAIQKAMYEVCNHPSGTASRYVKTKVKMAGKTGTAQVVGIKQNIKERQQEHTMAYFTRSHAWMTTYAPYSNPKYVVTVLVEHGGHGGAATGDIVSAIYDKLVELGYLEASE